LGFSPGGFGSSGSAGYCISIDLPAYTPQREAREKNRFEEKTEQNKPYPFANIARDRPDPMEE
jgi:hypothetical protein